MKKEWHSLWLRKQLEHEELKKIELEKESVRIKRMTELMKGEDLDD